MSQESFILVSVIRTLLLRRLPIKILLKHLRLYSLLDLYKLSYAHGCSYMAPNVKCG